MNSCAIIRMASKKSEDQSEGKGKSKGKGKVKVKDKIKNVKEVKDKR